MLGAVGGAFGDAIAALSDDANGGGWRRRCYCVRTQPVRQGWREGEWRNQDGNGEEGLPEPQLLHCLLRGRKGIGPCRWLCGALVQRGWVMMCAGRHLSHVSGTLGSPRAVSCEACVDVCNAEKAYEIELLRCRV